MMTLNPDRVISGHHLARLTRFVEDLPAGVLCDLDTKTNINRVNRELYDSLPKHQQRQVMRATTSLKVEPARANDDFAQDSFREVG